MGLQNILAFAAFAVCLSCRLSSAAPAAQCASTGGKCITAVASSCRGLPDGDYQACEGCTFYHSCVAGSVIYAYRDCPLTNQGGLNGKLVWDDNVKRCEYTSSTCRGCNNGNDGNDDRRKCKSTGCACIGSSAGSCNGLTDGNYQACEGCTFYHTCRAGSISSAFNDCPLSTYGGLHGRLVWDNRAKQCTYQSNTCYECEESEDLCHTHRRRCLPETPNACVGQLDGDYQSCGSCHRYISCKNQQTWDNRPCPEDINGKWSWVISSRTQGYCWPLSETCNNCRMEDQCKTGEGCIEESETTCQSMADGDYQSCSSCHVYISCRNGATWTKRPCPFGPDGKQQVWTITSPTQGHCTSQSATCNECPIAPIDPIGPGCLSTGRNCITAHSSSCKGRADGHYQACEGCTIYHSCSGGVIWANRPCPLTNYGGINGRLVWVQLTATEGRCDYASSTCSHNQCMAAKESEDKMPLDDTEEQKQVFEDIESAKEARFLEQKMGNIVQQPWFGDVGN